MVRVLSEELKARMQRARKRKQQGYTCHLEIAGKMAMEKIEGLFKDWELGVEDALFRLVAMDWKFNIILDMMPEGLKFKDVVSIAVKFLAEREVSEVGIECFDEGALKATEQTGNVVFVRKKGLEYLIESQKEWNRRLGFESLAKEKARLKQS